MKKIYRSKLSFDLVIEVGKLEATTGIQIGLPCVTTEEKKKMMESFGLFGGSANDGNKFYENIKGLDGIIPKPEDYVEVPFRLLSATVVGAGSWKASDFTDVGLLRGSVGMLANKPVYVNHDMSSVDNWVGMVKTTKWTDAFSQDGIHVPGGIDGILAIDTKIAPKTARGVLSGAVYSNSVTVEFDWEPSHLYENEWDFLNAIGTLSKTDGKMVRRIAKAIHNYHESSLVFLGADPFAKMIDDKGNLRHIDVGSIEYSKANLSYDKLTDNDKEAYKANKTMNMAIGLEAGLLSYAKGNFDKAKQELANKNKPENKPTNLNQVAPMKKLFAFIQAMMLKHDTKFSFTAEQFTPENEDAILAEFTKLMAEKDKGEQNLTKAASFDTVIGLPLMEIAEDAEAPTETKVTLTDAGELPEKMTEEYAFVKKASLTGLFGRTTALKKDAELGKSFLKEQRDETIRLYKLSVGTEVNEAVVTLMQNADVEALKGFMQQYGKKSLEQFGGKCNKCESTDISFRSTKPTEEEGGKSEKAQYSGKSFEEIYKENSVRPMRAGRNG